MSNGQPTSPFVKWTTIIGITISALGLIFNSSLVAKAVESSKIYKHFVPEKEASPSSFEILKSGLNDYAKKYVKAHNENDMSYIRGFYADDSSLYEDTKNNINNWYNENLKVESLKEQIIKPDRIDNSNTYNVTTNLEFSYNQNGRLGTEKVKGRIFQIEITNKNKIVLETVVDPGKSTVNWENSDNNFDIIKSGLDDYAIKYVKAHNENDMSYIKEFYSDESSLYEDMKKNINNWYNENLKVNSLEEQIISLNRIDNSNMYNVITNLEFSYNQNGKLGTERVVGRIFQIEITNKNKIVFETVIDPGKSTLIWEK